MRSTERKRPIRRRVDPQPEVNLESLAGRVSYVGSREHKDSPSFAGQPKPRADAQSATDEWPDNKIR